MFDDQISFAGIESPTQRRQVKELMDELTPFCPSDSTVRATFSRLHDHFLADIKVASEGVVMHAVDRASVLGDALVHVRAKLMDQIEGWREQRFAT